MIRIEWIDHKWSPQVPSQSEYEEMRGLSEPEMKAHLKTILGEVRKQLDGQSPYRYRAALWMAAIGAAMMLEAWLGYTARFMPDVAEYVGIAGALVMLGAGFHAGSTSFTHDTRRREEANAREFYVRC